VSYFSAPQSKFDKKTCVDAEFQNGFTKKKERKHSKSWTLMINSVVKARFVRFQGKENC
jgi:hypothetical protein